MSCTKLLKALVYAAEKHKTQKRKSSDSCPFINHPIGVVENLARIGKIEDVEILQAGFLHDVVEDTDGTLEEIEEMFGKTVAKYVDEVSDNKQENKADRKIHQIEHAASKSLGARCIKLADKLHNCTDLSINAPPSWSLERVRGYFIWSKALVDTIRGTNQYLEDALDTLFARKILFQGEEVDIFTTFDKEELHKLLNEYYDSMRIAADQ